MDPKQKKTAIIIASVAVVAVVAGLIITYVIIPATKSSGESPIDCIVNYSNWSSCNSSGVRSATGTITTSPSNGGSDCPPLNITEKCPVDCVVSDWKWGDCGYDGLRIGNRTVATPSLNGGTGCPPLSITQSCDPPVDCVVNWSNFSNCDFSGFQKSTATVTTPSANGGIPCPTELVKTRQCGPTYIGCYKDSGDRALTQFSDHKTVAECNDIAKAANSPYFGMQYWQTDRGENNLPGTKAQCWYKPESTLETSTKYGQVSNGSSNYCKQGTNGFILGDSFSNAIYKTF